ncbi:glycosyl transferase [Edaphobacter acidisoli]|uniref:Glycosyl transferase n=1 Tax=Edaphobacter acidisoli TaxID=2040573 RepID=A0A916S158_9BACT|nr:glycosyltransferase family 1 protein [Edaphobacter acidisoli]GGA79892.1 glycosyl transferase [Edaphobacter acidisoli]
MKKTLCIDLRWIDSSGVGVYIKGIMPGIVERLRDVSIVGLGDRSRLQQFSWSQADNMQLVDCQAGRYSLAEQIQLPLAIPRGTDLFFSPYYTIPMLYRGRLAVTVHDLSHRVVLEIIGDRKKRIYAETMFRALRKRASVIFTVSNFSKSELVRLTTGRREDNIIPTHLGISTEWYGAAQLPRTHTRPYFIYVGNIKPYKNLGRLVEAFLRIKDRVPQDLLIVGQSEGLITGESAEFFERVRGAGERIRLTGPVPYKELLSLVGHSDALVMPSLYEGFGLPPVEAMAAGVPVAVANAASLPEVCGDGALYFDPLDVEDIANKLVRIASDSALRKHLTEKGLGQSRLYRWEFCSTKTADGLRAHLESDDGQIIDS